jgi:hypothetical protein
MGFYNGGPTDGANILERRSANYSGGQPGYVNTTMRVESIVGKDAKSFEWNFLSVLDNHADAGENCAGYFQGNRYGYGAVWGLCIETRDKTNKSNPETGQIGLELDVFANGPDIYGRRVGIDIISGKGLVDGAPTETQAGLRITNTHGNPSEGRYKNGIHLSAPMDVGIRNSTDGMIGYADEGTKNIGIALMGNYTEGALRFKAGNNIAWEATNCRTTSWQAGKWTYKVNGADTFSVYDDGRLDVKSADDEYLYIVVNNKMRKIKLV